MKIGYFADGAWSHKALDLILESSKFQVLFIVARYKSQDMILADYAKKLGIPFLVHPNVNSQEIINIIKDYNADLLVSMSFNQIIKAELIQLAHKGFINCHAGALPFYRGRNILNWALINGEKRFGVTIHYIDEGIDTGDIILQKFKEISTNDDYASLLEKAYELCAETLFEALLLIDSDKVCRIPQDSNHPVGFYCGRRRAGDEWIDWSWTSERIHNFIRAITEPGPCAQTISNDQIIKIKAAHKIPNAPNYIGTPGEIVGKNPEGIIVKTGDSTLLITEYTNTPPLQCGYWEEIWLKSPRHCASTHRTSTCFRTKA